MPFFPSHIENKSLHFSEKDQALGYTLPLDLNRLLISNPPATFFARLETADGELLIIDKSAPVHNNSVVVVAIDGELVVRRVAIIKGVLKFNNGKVICPEDTIWGVVKYVIQKL